MAKLKFLPHGAASIDGVRVEPQPARLLLVLMGRPLATREFISEALWPDPDRMPDLWANNIAVAVHKLRKAGVQVVNRHGQGYSLAANL